MAKLLICILCAGLLAAVMLQLRQQRLELAHQLNKLHGEIELVQIKLWNQQLQIATCTAPNAIAQTVKQYEMTLVPGSPSVIAEDHSADAE